jgi:hypothetical protein
MGVDRTEMRLGEIEARHFGSIEDAVASLLEAVALVNEQLEDNRVGPADLVMGRDWGERIRRWVERLQEIANRAAQETGANSFSITVQAPPPAVGLSLTWDVEPVAHGGFRVEARVR